MPEGDTAFRVARNLHRSLAGKALTRIQVRAGSVPEVNLQGEQILGAEAFGKHLLVRIGAWTLHSHMLMDGVWHIYRRGARWRLPGYQARLILEARDVQAVGFQVAKIRLVPTAEEVKLISHLGPDPLKDAWGSGGMELAAANLGEDRREIHVALLDQTNVAGLGNVYANELCFLLGTDPHRPATEVNAKEFLELGARLLKANLDRVERTTTGDTRPGRRLYVYGRAGRPCLRCGTIIARTSLKQRVVFWCPHCQPSRKALA